ncbi:MAG: hypothetical protein IPM29_10630 [Planctomycetes bacterium]|nr:hypothetical protein [Planctomycetota bacterium]
MVKRMDDGFGGLLREHAGRLLDAAGRQRLRELAAGDAEREAELQGLDDLHERFAAARAVAAVCLGEETDLAAGIGADALRAAAARGSAGLAAQLRAHAAARRRRRGWLAVAAAALVAVGLWLASGAGGRSAPGLLGGRPDDAVLGGRTRIDVPRELRWSAPALRWDTVPGAVRYDAALELAPRSDGPFAVLLERPAAQAATARWELSVAELESLRGALADAGASAALRLRVAARDATGVVVATSGPVPLRIDE